MECAYVLKYGRCSDACKAMNITCSEPRQDPAIGELAVETVIAVLTILILLLVIIR